MINLKAQRAAGAGSVVLVGGIALNAVLNYGFGVTLAWLLPQDDFGAVSVLLSVLLLAATVLAAGFPWALARTVARADGAGPAARAEADSAFRAALLGNVGLGLFLAAVLIVVQLTTGKILPGASVALTLTMAGSVVLISLYSVLWGAVHGVRCFDAIGLTQLAETLLKVAGGLVLVGLCGFGVGGVATAVLASIVVAVWLSCRALGDRLPRPGPVASARAFATAAPMAVGTIGFGLLTTLDILVLSALGHDHGLGFATVAVYQAAAVLARAPVLLSSALAEAMFPFIARERTKAEAHRWFQTGFRWVPLAFVPAQLVLLITPGSVLGLLFPASYDQAAELARVITIGTTGLIVADMLLKALLARGLAGAIAVRIPVSVAVQLVALFVLVPRFGALGAATSFAAGSWAAAGLLASVYVGQYWPGWLRMRTVVGWGGAVGVLALVLATATLVARPLDLLVILVGLGVYAALAVRLRLVPEADVAAVRTRLMRLGGQRTPAQGQHRD
ncbi:MAG TPA: oligosaccharide flippase family protein [Pseudonocardiaceae bacterium]